jgi:hypothetical protein
MSNLQNRCDFINDMIAGQGVVAVIRDSTLAWCEVRDGVEYPVTQKRAFRKLVQAGYNPKALIEYAQSKFTD